MGVYPYSTGLGRQIDPSIEIIAQPQHVVDVVLQRLQPHEVTH